MENMENIKSKVEILSDDLKVLSEFVKSLENSVSEVSSIGDKNYKTTNDIREIEKDVLENLSDSEEQKN